MARLEVRLYHPVTPSISSTSQAKKSHGISFDIIVDLSTSSSDTPPAVTNSSPGLRPTTDIVHPHQRNSAIQRRVVFDICPIGCNACHGNFSASIASTRRLGRYCASMVSICFFGVWLLASRRLLSRIVLSAVESIISLSDNGLL